MHLMLTSVHKLLAQAQHTRRAGLITPEKVLKAVDKNSDSGYNLSSLINKHINF